MTINKNEAKFRWLLFYYNFYVFLYGGKVVKLD